MQQASTDPYPEDGYDQYPSQGYNGYNEYPPQQFAQGVYPGQQQPYSDMAAGAAVAGAAGVGAAGAAGGSSAAAAMGIHDQMMVRVKVAFVRSLEDELGQLKLPSMIQS